MFILRDYYSFLDYFRIVALMIKLTIKILTKVILFQNYIKEIHVTVRNNLNIT